MGAPDLLHHLRASGFTLASTESGGIHVVPSAALTDALRQSIRDHRAELLALLTPRTDDDPDRWCWPNSEAMNGAELARYAEREQRFCRGGLPADRAESMADRLVIRDRTQDDRHTCPECAGYRPGRCGNHRAARLHTNEVGHDLAALLQRCPGFTACTSGRP